MRSFLLAARYAQRAITTPQPLRACSALVATFSTTSRISHNRLPPSLGLSTARQFSTIETPPTPGRRRSPVRPKSKRQKELSLLVRALQLFYAREKHFAVPIAYEIPRSTAWPADLRGLALGIKTHKLMQLVANGKPPNGSDEYLAALDAAGFPVYTWHQYNFETVLVPALKNYEMEHGDLFVPQKFVVPSSHANPKETWGFPLGLQVAKLRRDKSVLDDDDVAALDAIGFIWNVRDAKWHQFFLPGLRLFKEIHGHVDVPLAFEIPDDRETERERNPWPLHMRGYRLGRHVYMVRSGKYAAYVEQSQTELEALGFAFDLSESLWNFTIFPSLEAFAHVYGHCDVPQDFVVPADDPWPESAYGWRLGHTVKSIRHQRVYEHHVQASRAELDRIGFVWNATDRVEVTARRIVLPAMKAYAQIHRDVLIGTDFVVPDSGGQWPQQARGFRLGHWITRVRAGLIDLPKAVSDELDQLGFVWRFNDERWNEVLLPAFRAYAERHGTCKGMSTKFHVPHDDAAYPRRSWGVNLGGALWHMKNGDTYVHDPLKERELKKLGVL